MKLTQLGNELHAASLFTVEVLRTIKKEGDDPEQSKDPWQLRFFPGAGATFDSEESTKIMAMKIATNVREAITPYKDSLIRDIRNNLRMLKDQPDSIVFTSQIHELARWVDEMSVSAVQRLGTEIRMSPTWCCRVYDNDIKNGLEHRLHQALQPLRNFKVAEKMQAMREALDALTP